ncbi:MAG: peptidoglycan DD-metalloendopeptidase family protein [Bacteroidaceae bacterium]|nr:peptidoglycan DD-metalloendopeptidase family protein [Bacteroidaceae bacterium]
MNRFAVTIVLFTFSMGIHGQTSSSIDKMRRERAEMEKQIAEQEQVLTRTENTISSRVSGLNAVTARLKERTRLLEQTRLEIQELDRENARLQAEVESLNKEYESCKESYADACRFYQRQHRGLNVLTFMLSAESFRQFDRRARYISEYSGSLKTLADEIREKRDTLEDRRVRIDSLKSEKLVLEKVRAENEQALRKEEQEQKKLIDRLRSQRTSLKNEIAAKQKRMDQLSKEIDRQIELALKSEQQKKQQQNSSSQMKEQPAQDLKLTGSFESNKGKLPMPITGPYLIVGEYGVQNVAGMKDVKQNNLGLDIQGNKGAQARAVFDGTVSSIFQQGKGQIGVLIRHGAYISVYCNLSDTRLQTGAKVKTGDAIGNIQTSEDGSPVLHFQLHKETTRLNPSLWLKK